MHKTFPMKIALALASYALLMPCMARPHGGGDADRISAVENGLAPAFQLKGHIRSSRTLHDEMRRLSVPGVSIAIVRGGELAWAKGYGIADKSGRSVAASTLFQAGSISKSVAALAALELVDEGALALDADVNDRLERWKVPGNEHTRSHPVTLRGLLSHSAGLSGHGFNGYAAGAPVPTLTQVLDGAAPANSPPVRVVSVPGMEYRYSGGGYTVLQALMVDATGLPFPDLVDKTLFQPLDMKRSFFEQPLPETLLADAAVPHDGKGHPVPGGAHTYPEMAAAGLWTTPTDLAKVLIDIHHAYAGRGAHVLSTATAKQMLTPVVSDYGLGVELGGKAGRRYLAKGGDTKGFVAYMIAFPETGDGAVIMTNGDQGAELTKEIMRGIANAYGWPDLGTRIANPRDVGERIRKELLGTYGIGKYGTFAVQENAQKQLLIVFPDDAPQRLHAISDNEFVELSQGTTLRFEGDGFARGTLTAERLSIPFEKQD